MNHYLKDREETVSNTCAIMGQHYEHLYTHLIFYTTTNTTFLVLVYDILNRSK